MFVIYRFGAAEIFFWFDFGINKILLTASIELNLKKNISCLRSKGKRRQIWNIAFRDKRRYDPLSTYEFPLDKNVNAIS